MSGADPVCVPASTFNLGDTAFANASPVVSVTLTTDVYVDRYPATKHRFEQCVTAGACTRPTASAYPGYAGLADDAFVSSNYTNASAFCAWDGGRLLTEFEWELAARGPSPDVRMRPWGTTGTPTCSYHATSSCLGTPQTISDYPMDTSPYGLRLMGNMPAWTSTPFLTDYSSFGASVTDPAVTISPGGRHTMRGTWYCANAFSCVDETFDVVSFRDSVNDSNYGLTTVGIYAYSIRCGY